MDDDIDFDIVFSIKEQKIWLKIGSCEQFLSPRAVFKSVLWNIKLCIQGGNNTVYAICRKGFFDRRSLFLVQVLIWSAGLEAEAFRLSIKI